MFTKDDTLEKVNNLRAKYVKLIVNLLLISSPNEKATLIKLLVELANEFQKIGNVESVVADSTRETGFDYDKEQGIFFGSAPKDDRGNISL